MNSFYTMFFIHLQIFFENEIGLEYHVVQIFTKTTCKTRVHCAEFVSTRLQKRLEYGENGKKPCFLACF